MPALAPSAGKRRESAVVNTVIPQDVSETPDFRNDIGCTIQHVKFFLWLFPSVYICRSLLLQQI